ncbi:MAG: four helix bundle protein [Bacteroidales bacterium]|nr:four helix bundle protein [Bacteroidales bacterium]
MAFRFQTLEVYQQTLEMSGAIFMLLNELQSKREYVIVDQMMRAFLSISNNIAEGSGSNSDKEFAYFLNISRRSVFECVNMIIIIHMKGHIATESKDDLFAKFDQISRKIQSLRRSLIT